MPAQCGPLISDPWMNSKKNMKQLKKHWVLPIQKKQSPQSYLNQDINFPNPKDWLRLPGFLQNSACLAVGLPKAGVLSERQILSFLQARRSPNHTKGVVLLNRSALFNLSILKYLSLPTFTQFNQLRNYCVKHPC